MTVSFRLFISIRSLIQFRFKKSIDSHVVNFLSGGGGEKSYYRYGLSCKGVVRKFRDDSLILGINEYVSEQLSSASTLRCSLQLKLLFNSELNYLFFLISGPRALGVRDFNSIYLILFSYPKTTSLDCGLTKSHINWFQQFVIGLSSSFDRVELWCLAYWLVCIDMHEVSFACQGSDSIICSKRRSFAIFYARQEWELLSTVALNYRFKIVQHPLTCVISGNRLLEPCFVIKLCH